MNDIPARLLLGPGPSNAHPAVLQAMSQPLLGHLDPAFLAVMDEVQEHLRTLFATENPFTLPLSATGSAGMEACLCNLLEPGDDVVVGVAGVFGGRMCEVAERIGARVTRVESAWGTALDPAAMAEAITRVRPRVVAFVHAETSTGVLQPVAEIAAAAHAAGALVVLDCVTSLGGVAVEFDRWGVDAAYSGTQKCLSCPPGLSPVSFSERALERVSERRTKVQSWYLDVTLLAGYFGGERVYHHTAPISSIYALLAGLRVVVVEGLDRRAERHRDAQAYLLARLADQGFEPLVDEAHRLPPLTTLRLPAAVRERGEAEVRRALLGVHGIEVGGGLGKLAGEVWRVGLMGENARRESVDRLEAALKAVLA
ncbi:MAG: aminotransferase class V-fold PLP-dependent enzyme [Planctomycetota bacterium]|jgi:alanine-glyoxylate transaminase/serine-glyoxylate transaminase/serine-pyruvate transaminase|nr:alanine--glyoxylate aminotransferase [Deltaproteobacteria bacterium]MDP6540540.1 aminotransferase class V-fold PLP-dependent enzyme [Planctomycetota bacterium]